MIRAVLLCALGMLCVGCSSAPQLRPETARLPERVELASVPFFFLSDSSGAASALAALLNHHGGLVTPGIIGKEIKALPAEQPQEIKLEVVARSFDQMAYHVSDLDGLIQQVASNQPVLVKLDTSFRDHDGNFALLIGYDQREQFVWLRKGNVRRWRMNLADFNDEWNGAGRWAVTVVPAGQLPEGVGREKWLDAAKALQKQGRDEAVQRALKAARQQWPDIAL